MVERLGAQSRGALDCAGCFRSALLLPGPEMIGGRRLEQPDYHQAVSRGSLCLLCHRPARSPREQDQKNPFDPCIQAAQALQPER